MSQNALRVACKNVTSVCLDRGKCRPDSSRWAVLQWASPPPPPRRDVLIAELLRQKDRLVVAPSAKIGGEKKDRIAGSYV